MKRKLKKGRLIVPFLLIIILVVAFILIKNNDSKDTKGKNKQIQSDTEVAKDTKDISYNLRNGEEVVGKSKTDKTITKYNGAYYVEGVMIVNKTYPLDSSYVPQNPYKEITSDYLYGGDYIEKEVMTEFLKMQNDASKLGYNLHISSGYRSYQVQVDLYNNYASRDGIGKADTYSARAGYSEHQSGLCFDLNGTNGNFLETETGKWVNENAYKYGFILRFPKNKENYTGYNYEAWHFRYVGIKLATILYNNSDWISLEEYLGIDSKYES